MKLAYLAFAALLSLNISYADQINLTCHDASTYAGARKVKLYGYGNFAVGNDTNTNQTLKYTLTVCSPVNECKSTSATGTSIPHQLYVSPPIDLYLTSAFTQYGSYNYKVTFDVTGFKTLHQETTCVLRVVK